MEKEKKKIRCSYALLVVILFATVCFLTDYIVIERKMNQCNCSKCEVTTNNGGNDELSVVEENKDTIYSNFANKMISERGSKFGQYSSSYVDVNSEIVGKYSVSLLNNGSLMIHYSNESESRMISNNVLSFYLINTGQNTGKTLFFIKEDGTVSKASIEYGYSADSDIKIDDNVNNLKNIVSIIPGSFSEDGVTGVRGPIFIDIYGKMYLN